MGDEKTCWCTKSAVDLDLILHYNIDKCALAEKRLRQVGLL